MAKVKEKRLQVILKRRVCNNMCIYGGDCEWLCFFAEDIRREGFGWCARGR